MSRLALWLQSSGWRTLQAGVGLNVNCSQKLTDRLAKRLEAATGRSGERAIVIGQSRGGQQGRVLAAQRPDLVDTSITLASPIRDLIGVNPHVVRQLRAMSSLGSWGVPGLMSRECHTGECCDLFRASLTGPPPDGVRLVSIWSASDRVADPEACQDPHAECRQVDSSHIGMSFNAGVFRVLADVLGTRARVLATV